MTEYIIFKTKCDCCCLFQASVCLWDGQAGAAGLSGARQSGKGLTSTEYRFLFCKMATWSHLFDCVFCCFIVWEGAHHHHPLQLHQTREGSTLPCPDEREGGHTVVHWAGEVSRITHTHTHTVEVGWWYRFTSDCNGGCVFVTLQDLWLPCPLHRRVQHGSRCPAEAPGPVLERPCYQASVRTTERLLRLWIDATRHQQTDATNKWTPAFLLWYWLLVKSWTFYPLSQSLWPGSVNVSAAGK